MMLNRRITSPITSATKNPSSSGPRCTIESAMRWTVRRISALDIPGSTMPAIPHMSVSDRRSTDAFSVKVTVSCFLHKLSELPLCCFTARATIAPQSVGPKNGTQRLDLKDASVLLSLGGGEVQTSVKFVNLVTPH